MWPVGRSSSTPIATASRGRESTRGATDEELDRRPAPDAVTGRRDRTPSRGLRDHVDDPSAPAARRGVAPHPGVRRDRVGSTVALRTTRRAVDRTVQRGPAVEPRAPRAAVRGRLGPHRHPQRRRPVFRSNGGSRSMPRTATTMPTRSGERGKVVCRVTGWWLLETFPAPAGCTRVRLTSDELTTLCPLTGQPDSTRKSRSTTSRTRSASSRSRLKLYLWSFSATGPRSSNNSRMTSPTRLRTSRTGASSVTITQHVRGGIVTEARPNYPRP